MIAVYVIFFFFLTVLAFHCCARASHCGGFSCCRARALGRMGFNSCGTWAQQLRLLGFQSTGSVVVAHGLSCPMTFRILRDQGSNSLWPALTGGFFTILKLCDILLNLQQLTHGPYYLEQSKYVIFFFFNFYPKFRNCHINN